MDHEGESRKGSKNHCMDEVAKLLTDGVCGQASNNSKAMLD